MKLSVAMMVKNEETHLERCLKSVLSLLPEIIILDTGSSDRTVEIAQKYTRHVYHQNWQNNFALHRNKSFSYATGDWVFQIDADEELIFEDPKYPNILKEFLSKLPGNVNSCALLMKDWRESSKRYVAELDIVRIFRRGKVRYKRRIHNEPMFEGPSAIIPFGIWIKHYGYDLTPEQTKSKAERTIGLLELSLQEDPEDYASYFYLAEASASWQNDGKKALEYAKKYYSHRQDILNSGKNFNPSVYYMAAAVADIDKNFDDKLKWLERGLKYNPGDMDLCWLQMTHGLKTKNPEFIVSGARGFAAAYESYEEKRLVESGKFVFNRKLESYAAALYYLSAGHLEGGCVHMRKLLRIVLPQCKPELQTEIKGKYDKLLEALDMKDIEELNENESGNQETVSEHNHKELQTAN
jgi:glycosyltransferase involved in cell wall biosynthesis